MLNFISETIIVILAVMTAVPIGLVIVLRGRFRSRKKQACDILDKIESVDVDIQKEREAIGRIKLGLEELSRAEKH